MISIESTGKKLDDAIKNGLAELNVTLDEVDVEILESGGFFKKARVRLTVIEEDNDLDELMNFATSKVDTYKKEESAPIKKEEKVVAKKEEKTEEKTEEKKVEVVEEVKEEKVEPATEKTEAKKDKVAKKKQVNKKPQFTPPVEKEYPPATEEEANKAKAYTEGLISAMGVEGTVEVSTNKNVINVNIITESALVIGHHGETLDAIQVLCKRVVESDDGHVRVITDCNGYREKRESTLVHLAKKTADRCVRRGRKISLEPMDSAQRKIIHSALTDDDRVFTKSEGREPNRRVIIFPVKRK